MQKNRTSLLAPFFSSMAILSFKKKDKEDKESDTPLMSSSKADTNLGGGSLGGSDLSLGGLDGGIGSLSDIDLNAEGSESLGDELLSMSGASQSDIRLQELEVSVNDIRKEKENIELATRAMKSEIESIKDEISNINESIKTLLNVYEAVSQQYNPFVDNATKPMAKNMGASSLNGNYGGGDQFGTMLGEEDEIGMGSGEADPFGEEEPLDRIIKPEDDSEDDITTLSGMQEEFTMNGENEKNMLGSDVSNGSPRYGPGMPNSNGTYEDIYALEQTRKLIESLMTKICKERSMGNDIDVADRRALDLWVGEFKRLGGI